MLGNSEGGRGVVGGETGGWPFTNRREWCPQGDSNPRYRLEGPMS